MLDVSKELGTGNSPGIGAYETRTGVEFSEFLFKSNESLNIRLIAELKCRWKKLWDVPNSLYLHNAESRFQAYAIVTNYYRFFHTEKHQCLRDSLTHNRKPASNQKYQIWKEDCVFIYAESVYFLFSLVDTCGLIYCAQIPIELFVLKIPSCPYRLSASSWPLIIMNWKVFKKRGFYNRSLCVPWTEMRMKERWNSPFTYSKRISEQPIFVVWIWM